MKATKIATKFIDSPTPNELNDFLSYWSKSDLADKLVHLIRTTGQEKPALGPSRDREFPELCQFLRKKLNSAKALRLRGQLEKLILDWLYDYIRLNIKRGRIFNLNEVLKTGSADCLGYAKLLTILGRSCGLDIGIVEVLIDNRGRVVPHTATLIRLAEGKRRFIDFWYGSKDIYHQRLGLRVKRAGRWRIEDINYQDIRRSEDINYLPDSCVDAITLYIEGNRCLKQGHYAQALEKYSQAIKWYPQNARAFYNRAIAYEKLGQGEKARADYKRALCNEDAKIRTLATQPEEIVDLIQLDEKYIPEFDQQLFLLHSGFITGRQVSPDKVAQKSGLSRDEIEAVLSFTSRLLGSDNNSE